MAFNLIFCVSNYINASDMLIFFISNFQCLNDYVSKSYFLTSFFSSLLLINDETSVFLTCQFVYYCPYLFSHSSCHIVSYLFCGRCVFNCILIQVLSLLCPTLLGQTYTRLHVCEVINNQLCCPPQQVSRLWLDVVWYFVIVVV